jgi:hypothetical protein
LSAFARSFARDEAVNAVSLPEKNAESTSSPRMAAVVSQKAVSSINIDKFPKDTKP